MRHVFLKFIRRRNWRRDLEAELEFHREMASAHGNAIPLGRVSGIKEESADLWRFTFAENLWRDVAYGARGLRKNPALVFGAAISLTLGIGANLALFSLAVEFFLSEPSVRDARSLISLRLGGNSNVSHQALELVRESAIFEDVVGEDNEAFVNWNDGRKRDRSSLHS